MRDFTVKDFLIGLLLCALQIWCFAIGGLICVIGEILTLPGKLLILIGGLWIRLGGD